MTRKVWTFGLALALSVGAAEAGERAAAKVECEATGKHLNYTCMIMLNARKSGVPVTAEKVVIKADMPTMPMAHNLPPAHAEPVEGKPGMYVTSLELEMFGEWALAIDVDGMAGDARVRDKVIIKQEFGEAHASGHEGHGDHSGHGQSEEANQSKHGHKKHTE